MSHRSSFEVVPSAALALPYALPPKKSNVVLITRAFAV